MYKKSLHANGELVGNVIRIDYKMDSDSCSHLSKMEIYVDLNHPLVSKELSMSPLLIFILRFLKIIMEKNT